jgi:hypothetical protein
MNSDTDFGGGSESNAGFRFKNSSISPSLTPSGRDGPAPPNSGLIHDALDASDAHPCDVRPAFHVAPLAQHNRIRAAAPRQKCRVRRRYKFLRRFTSLMPC